MNTELSGKKLFEPDYQSSSIPESVRIWKPVVYEDGDSFRCRFAEPPWSYILGCGATPEQAMEDWDRDLHREMELVTGLTIGHA
jgi:hypothetical protein